MKKSTLKLIIYTVLGIIASLIFYQLSKISNPMMTRKTLNMITVGIYICPFIGFINWLFTGQLDD